MIQFCVGEHNALNRCMAYYGTWPERWESVYLALYIRRDIEEKPMPFVGADRNGRLCAWPARKRANTYCMAVWTVAIPLREAATGSRSQDTYPHIALPHCKECAWQRWCDRQQIQKCCRSSFPQSPVIGVRSHLSLKLIFLEIWCNPFLHSSHPLSNKRFEVNRPLLLILRFYI